MRSRPLILGLAVVLCAALPAAPQSPAARAGLPDPAVAGPAGPATREAYQSLPLRFEPNQGQFDPHVDFVSRGSGYTLFLTAREAVLDLGAPSGSASPGKAVRLRLSGAGPDRRGEGSVPLAGATNYLIGSDRDKWVTGVPGFAKVSYREVYPGVDLVYYGDGEQRLEYDFNVAPGADASAIAVSFEGNRGLSLDADGSLVVATGAGELRQHRPVVYQQIDGRRRPVSGGYRIDGQMVRFDIGEYDRSIPLVIDPVLTYASYLGGTSPDEANSVAVSPSGGYAYITGTTQSTDLPSTSPSPEGDKRAKDVFVAKFATAATGAATLVYATYLGGSMHPDGPPRPCIPAGGVAPVCEPDVDPPLPPVSNYLYPNGTGGDDSGLGVTVDAAGVAYVTGITTSHDFPTSPNAYDHNCGTRADKKCDYSTHNYNEVYIASDAFVAALNPAGSDLVYSTYLGGSGNRSNTIQSQGAENDPNIREPSGVDAGRGIATDGTGSVYVTGSTTSPDFPKTIGKGLTPSTYCRQQGPDCREANPFPDAFLVKIDTTVSVAQRDASLVHGMYFGRPGRDIATGVAIGPQEQVYFVGSSATKHGSHDRSSFTGKPDGFVAKFQPGGCVPEIRYEPDPSGGTREDLYCTRFIGNSDPGIPDTVNAVAVNSNGVGYLVGERSGSDAFVASFGSGFGGFHYFTNLGGTTGADSATGVAADGDGHAYVTGYTGSASFPVKDPLRPPSEGISDSAPDAFVTKLAADGTLVWSTHLGGKATAGTLANGEDRARGIAIDDDGNAYVAGMTVSKDFPAIEPFQDELGGSSDAFLARIDAGAAGAPTVAQVDPSEGPPGTLVTITGTGFTGAASVRFGDVPVPPSAVTVSSDAKIQVRSPVPDEPGQAVTVSVRTALGVSRSGLDGRYTYHQGSWGEADPRGGGQGFFQGATMTLLDGPGCHKPGVAAPGYCGKVLLAGGGGPQTANGSMFHTQPTKVTRLFDPKTGIWSPGEPLLQARFGHSATLLADGSVLVVSDAPDAGDTFGVASGRKSTAEVYRPSQGKWSPTVDPLNMVGSHTATLLDGPACATTTPGPGADSCGKVLVVSGGSAQLFDPRVPAGVEPLPADAPSVHLGRWTATAGPSVYRGRGHSATLLREPGCGRHCGKVLVSGGETVLVDAETRAASTREITASAELYDPVMGTWERLPDMAGPRLAHTATQMADGRVLVSGGRSIATSATGTRSAEVFDPTATDAAKYWRLTGSMRAIHHSHTATALPSGQVLIAGGVAGGDFNNNNGTVYNGWLETTTELYDPRAAAGSGRWLPAGTLPRPPGWPLPSDPAGGQTLLGDLPEGGVLLSSRSNGFGADAAICGDLCGLVLVGPQMPTTSTYQGTLYTPPPWVSAVTPTGGPAAGGVPLTITGGGFSEGAQVLFGRTPASVTSVSYGEMKAVSPAMPSGLSPVRVARHLVGVGAGPVPFVTGGPAAVTDLVADATSTTEIRLSFSAPGAGGGMGSPASSYVVKQSTSPIDAGNFDAAKALCADGVCGGFEPGAVGTKLELDVGGLLPDTRYHYAIKAVDPVGTIGDISNGASAVTGPVAPGVVSRLEAIALSASEVDLAFGAAGSNAAAPPPAGQYLIRRATAPITDEAAFEAAVPVCPDGTCRFTPARVGTRLGLVAGGLDPERTYHFAVRARDEAGNLGPVSASVEATTLRTGCLANLPAPGSGQVAYPAGYSLVALPAGTDAKAHSRLFSWFDQGAGGTYSEHPPNSPVEGGRAYWAWASCPRLVDLAGAGSASASLALSAFRASMVGNPSGVAPATITGHDFTARWDRSLNGGTGGYDLSGYREAQDLAVGEGIWAFSYAATTLSIKQR